MRTLLFGAGATVRDYRPTDAATGPPRSRWSGNRGSSVITFVLLLPVLVAFAELIVVGGRVTTTRADVQSAAREAARQASIAAGPGSADDVIGHAVAVALADKGFRCEAPTVVLGSGTLFIRGGQVEVVVTCRVQLSDIDLLSAPGSVTITRSATEPIDQYRVIDLWP